MAPLLRGDTQRPGVAGRRGRAAGGLVGIVMSTQLLGGSSMSDAVTTIRMALESAGNDHVAIGSDWTARYGCSSTSRLPRAGRRVARLRHSHVYRRMRDGRQRRASFPPGRSTGSSRKTGRAEVNAAEELDGKHHDRGEWRAGHPLKREERNDRRLSDHQELPRVRGSPFVAVVETPRPKASARMRIARAISDIAIGINCLGRVTR